MLRIILFLIIVGGLTLFALQNISPLPLVILGTQTQALPLSVWILGAIAAGALTTLVFAVLFRASNAIAPPRARSRPAAKRPLQQSPNQPPPQSWTSRWGTSPEETEGNPGTYSAYTSPAAPNFSASSAATANPRTSAAGDDWEKVGRPVEEWDDWEPPQTASRSESSYTPHTPSSSNNSTRFQNTRTVIQEPEEQEPEEWDDWEEDEGYGEGDRNYPRDEQSYPRRTDFEIPQQPRSSYRSGSMYSYSYRDNEETVVDASTFPGQNTQVDHNQSQSSGVYDAEYRLITPPIPPDPDITPAPAEADDWGFDDDELDDSASRSGKR